MLLILNFGYMYFDIAFEEAKGLICLFSDITYVWSSEIIARSRQRVKKPHIDSTDNQKYL